ncbi:IS3 family transposase [Undibacterium sp. TJN25]|uniref:IS3 family transposase n=1 Tax=Undibacterium sp. TJN25 TaxID=3413056 RepID=UPI003BF40661
MRDLSANLMQIWLAQFYRGERDLEEAAAATADEYEAHIVTLERKVGQLTIELDLRKKRPAATCERQRDLIDCPWPEACSVRRGCQVIAPPRSTYYYRPSAAERQIDDLVVSVGLIDDLDGEFHDGYCRVTLELKRGYVVNRKRVAKIMEAHDLDAHRTRRFKPAKGFEADLRAYPNLYLNNIPTEPDRVWVADITYIHTQPGLFI